MREGCAELFGSATLIVLLGPIVRIDKLVTFKLIGLNCWDISIGREYFYYFNAMNKVHQVAF